MNSSVLHRTLLARGSLATILVVSGVVACSSSPPASKEQTATTSNALTIKGLFPTGVDDLGVQLTPGAVDPHYTLSSADPSCPGPDALATNPDPAWIGNVSPATWISCMLNDHGAMFTDYTYTTTFTLPASVPPSTVTISGLWACDDYCSIVVNGQATGVVSPNRNYSAPTAPSSFVIPAGTNFFRAGINTIQFVVTNVEEVQGLQIVSISGSAGCSLDTDCGTGTFCNTQTAACVAQLANGVAIPTIPGHIPELDGTCTTAVGAVVCQSGVCDTADNVCGFDIGHACTANTECRSNECDPTTNLCVPACAVDSDCAAGNFCNTELFVCTPLLDNGAPIPTIPGHTPPLDGICTPDVGAAVCASGVCDTSDNMCGLADGSGVCTTNAQCRSDNCNLATGLCGPSLPCCGNTYGAEMGSDAGCILCDDAGVPKDAGRDASADAAPDSGSNVANGSDNTVQDPQGSGGNNPASTGNGASARGGGGCQMGGGASNAGLSMAAGLLAMTVAAAARRRQKAVRS